MARAFPLRAKPVRMRPAPVLFISDLHLAPERPLPVSLFHRFMTEIAPEAAALYILGDFFEAWVGDDDMADAFNADIVLALRRLSDQGVATFFLPGNRDFLVGADFALATGLKLLPDPTRIDLYGTPTLLSHGDLFCTDDTAYQAFRSQVRDQEWQVEFLRRPLRERHDLARALREHSEHAKTGKKPDIMDVNAETVVKAIKNMQAGRVIHGHTHRPARHTLQISGKEVERWVLTDWYESGGYLRCDAEGCRALGFA